MQNRRKADALQTLVAFTERWNNQTSSMSSIIAVERLLCAAVTTEEFSSMGPVNRANTVSEVFRLIDASIMFEKVGKALGMEAYSTEAVYHGQYLLEIEKKDAEILQSAVKEISQTDDEYLKSLRDEALRLDKELRTAMKGSNCDQRTETGKQDEPDEQQTA